MRVLLVFVVVMLLAWRWRTARTALHRADQRKQASPPAALDMVPCGQCGVHIPANDAVTGLQGAYCSTDHLRQTEP